MSVFSQEFKVQSVEKALSRRPEQSLKQIAVTLGVGYSTLQKWIRLAKKNQLEKQSQTCQKKKALKIGIQ
ncbi:transposase [methane-oxidizing endosymbiont of Gigantopelta aegis]|uniref:transposase n=1 Tax=methane-oxidizing endosymbiont of Gigantopelta aegis TaxID=2794938 RepID=UPI003CC9254E